ncbi:hypothetical protein [uncultured Bacteroides sp.]|uniref:hypothetical protein n=1 Tax=uncultured Bacteroides sp. TaxID=162156 RepID=UPI002AAC07A1|nr:hypothetical protein [uncultured Bacteroides sp.]
MVKKNIETIVFKVLKDYCINNDISAGIDNYTPLIGENKILDSIGLVNVIVDIETAFFDEGVEVSLTSEAAMSGRISPFRSINSLCNFIENQLATKENG